MGFWRLAFWLGSVIETNWFPNEQPLGLVLSCLDFWHPSGRQGVREHSACAWSALGQLCKAIVSQDYSVAEHRKLIVLCGDGSVVKMLAAV